MSEEWRIRTNEAVGSLAEANQLCWRTVTDAANRVQRRNTEFAQSFFENTIETFRTQAEVNRSIMDTFFKQVARQQEALQALGRESFEAYTAFLGSLFSYPTFRSMQSTRREFTRRGVEHTGRTTPGNPALPIEDYDRLSVEQIVSRLGALNSSQIEQLRAYEKRHKNRQSLLERLDHSLV